MEARPGKPGLPLWLVGTIDPMPAKRCSSNGSPGWKWGDAGKCYTYTDGDSTSEGNAKKKAYVQGYAMGELKKSDGYDSLVEPRVSPEVEALVHKLGRGDTVGFTPQERDAARAISQHVGVRKDAGTGSLIVAWYPYQGDGGDGDKFAEELAVDGGLAPEELHLTLAYMGDAAECDADLITAVCKIFTVTYGYGLELEGEVCGVGRFIGEEDQDCVVALVDCDELKWFRERICEMLCQVGQYPVGDHGYIPHITLAYVDKGKEIATGNLQETIEFEIDGISVRGMGPDGAQFQNNFAFPESGPEGMGDAEQAFMAARSIVEKAGRVMSAKNLKLVRAAADALQALAIAAGQADGEETTTKESEHVYSGELEQFITKQRVEDRYTFGPLYAPDRADAHGEFTDADTLQKAVWDYVRSSAEKGRRINLQHDDSGATTVGEWVEVTSWPYETTVKVRVPGEKERELTMPAGTIYMGVVWDEDAWELVKTKKLTGYSLGGRTVRVHHDVDLETMGDKHAAKETDKKDTSSTAMHDYVKADNADVCASCGKAYGSGNHFEKKSSDTTAKDSSSLIIDAALAERERHAAELAKEREERVADRGIMSQLLDSVRSAFEKGAPAPDIHVHLPEQNVTINEAGIEEDPEPDLEE